MAIKAIAHKPGLTKEDAQAIFVKHFADKYRVERCDSPLSLKTKYRDFQVVKNPILGVALKLEQTPTETKFVYAAVPPRRSLRVLTLGMTGAYCQFFGGSLIKEIEEFIDSAPEFK
jgi:hypothetical protein